MCRIKVNLLLCCMTSFLYAGCATEVNAKTGLENQDVLRSEVAAQATAEASLWPTRTDIPPEALRYEAGPQLGRAIQSWRVWGPRDHSHPYLVASANGRPFALGGFQNPDLVALSSVLAPPRVSPNELLLLSEKLALAADPSGSVQYGFPQQSAAKASVEALRVAWQKEVPSGWPADTVAQRGGSGWWVRLTLISRESRSYTEEWVPAIYVFNFDGSGHLLAWARRAGTPFGAPAITATRTVEPWM